MKRLDFYSRSALRLLLLFALAIAGTFLSDHLHATGWFGDHWGTERKWDSGGNEWDYTPVMEWGARHYWYVWGCGSLFVIGLARVVTSGIVAAYHATQNTHGFDGLTLVVMHAQANAGVVGGWYNTTNARFYFDSVRIFTDLTEAIAFGRSEQQIAIFDLDNLKEIRL